MNDKVLLTEARPETKNLAGKARGGGGNSAGQQGSMAASIADAVREPMVFLDNKLKIKSANRVFYQTFRLSPKEAEGCLLSELGDQRWNTSELSSLVQKIMTGNDFTDGCEVKLDVPGIGRSVLAIHARKIIQEDQEELVLLVFEDIPERFRIQQQVKRVSSELHRFIETANAPIFGIDHDGLITEWNQTAQRITGFGKAEVVGKHLVKDFITEDYMAPVQEVLEKALRGVETDSYEFPIYTKDGRRVMLLLNATTRRNARGEIVGVMGVGQDITEIIHQRENLEEILEERTAELRRSLKDTEKARDRTDAILKSVADGLIATDNYNRIILMNRAAEDILATRFSEVIDRPIDFAIKDNVLRDEVKATLKKKETGLQFDFELPQLRLSWTKPAISQVSLPLSVT